MSAHGMQYHSQSAPGLLFNAQSMKDLLGGALKEQKGGLGNSKPKHSSSKPSVRASSTQSMGEALIQSILRQETGNPHARMPAAQSQSQSKKSTKGIRKSARDSAALNGGSGGQSQNQVPDQAPGDPLERARTMRKSQNSVHAFAPVLGGHNQTFISGDEVSYLERQYDRVNTILRQNSQKIEDGYNQLVVESTAATAGSSSSSSSSSSSGASAGGNPPVPATANNSMVFTEDDANLLLLFAGITYVDDDENEDICLRASAATAHAAASLKAQVAATKRRREQEEEEEKKKKNAALSLASSSKGRQPPPVRGGGVGGGVDDALMRAAVKFVQEEEEEEGLGLVVDPADPADPPPSSSSPSQPAGSPRAADSPMETAQVAAAAAVAAVAAAAADEAKSQAPAPESAVVARVIAQGEVDYPTWRRGVLSCIRKKLLAGILAEKRGQLAKNFMDVAEQSSVMMHAMAPPKGKSQSQKQSNYNNNNASAVSVRVSSSRPGSGESGGLGVGFADSVTEQPYPYPAMSSSGALFGEASVDDGPGSLFPDGLGLGFGESTTTRKSASSLIGSGGGFNKTCSVSSQLTKKVSMLDAGGGSLFNSSQSTAGGGGGDSSGLPPLQLRKSKSLSKVASMNSISISSSSIASKKKAGAVAAWSDAGKNKNRGSSSSSLAPGGMSADELTRLRMELQLSQDGLRDLDNKVESNLAWVHSNCDVQTATISDRTKDRCRKMALDRLFSTLGGFIETTLSFFFDRWKASLQFDEVTRMASVYARAKSMEQLTHAMSEALTRQYVKAWTPWLKMFSVQKRWEQEAASMEIGRVVRGFVGRRRALYRKKNVSAVRIQCMARCRRARKRVVHRRKYLRLFRAAKRIQAFFTFLVLRTKARAECQRRRDLRAAKANIAAQRKLADSIKRQAEEKLKEEKNAQRKKANAAANSVKSEGSRGRAAPAKAPSAKSDRPASAIAPSPGSPKGGSQSGSPAKNNKPARTASASSKHAAPAPATASGNERVSTAGKSKSKLRNPIKIEPDVPDFMQEPVEAAEEVLAAPAPYNPMQKKKKNNANVSVERVPEPEFGFDDDMPAVASASSSPSNRGPGGLTSSSSFRSSPDAFASGQVSSGGDNMVRGPIVSKADALRLKEEAERYLMSDPDYAKAVRERDALLAAARASSPTNKKSNVPAAADEDDEPYLTTEQVAEQDRLRAILEEARIKKEKEDAYIAAQEAKAKEIADAAQKKADALSAKDRAEFEKAEAIRIAKEEAAEAKAKAQREADERVRVKEEAEAAKKQKEREAIEAKKKEKEDAAAFVALRAKEIEDAKRKAKEEIEAELAARNAPVVAAAAPSRPLSARLMDGFRSILTPRKDTGRPNSARVPAAGDSKITEGDETETAEGGKKPKSPSEKGAPAAGSGAAAARSSAGSPERPQSALGNMFRSAKNLLGMSPASDAAGNEKGGGGIGGLLRMPKSLKDLTPIKTPVRPKGFDPATAQLISKDLAIARLQRQGRRPKARARVAKQRELIMKEQARAGRYILWAVVLMQRTARARLGRKRFTSVKVAVAKALEELRGRMCVKIQCAARRRLAVVRCKRLWIEKGEAQKAAEWKKYQEDSGRRAKLKVLAAGTPRKKRDSDDEEENKDITTWGIDPAQVNEMDQKIRRLEEIEKNIELKEKSMKLAQEASEKRARELEAQLKKLEEKQKSDEAERMVQLEMMKNAMGSGGPMQTGRSMMGTGGGGRGPMSARMGSSKMGPGPGPASARLQPASSRGNLAPQMSARHSAPPTARSARQGGGIPPDAPRMKYEGQDWVQLWDPDEKATYWYCELTQMAQWDEPGTAPAAYDSGYDTEGAITDYSTDYYSGAETDYSADYASDSVWAEYWDESAQAKYYYNNITGEASWTRPDDMPDEAAAQAAQAVASVPQGARQFPNEWVSYIDEGTNSEYWYNSSTGETSWG